MWYRFAAYNSQSVYGYGSEAEAIRYCEILNRGRDINHYWYEPLADDDAEATDMCPGLCDIAADGVELETELAADGERDAKLNGGG